MPSKPADAATARRLSLAGTGFGNDLVLAGLILLVLVGFGLAGPRFLSFANLVSIGQQTAVIAIVGFAMTAVIIARGIDISVGSTLAIAGIVAAQAYGATGSPLLGILAALAAGGAIGLINGLLISAVGISPFIATLATLAAGKGAALSLSGASSIPVDSPVLLWAGGADIAGFPVSLLLALLLLAGWWVLLHRTVLGRWIFAVGGNAGAARASLIPVRTVQTLTYVLAGMSAGLGAVVIIGRLGSAQPLAGTGLEFAAITAAIVGGTKLSGGEGSVTGTALGALLLGAINTGLSFLQVPQQAIYIVTGGLVLFAVLLSQRDRLAATVAKWRRRSRAAHTVEEAAVPRCLDRHELRIVGLGKIFPGVKALEGVAFDIRAGEVVALAGENGAGKSTLVKCLSGVHQPDEGGLILDGRPVRLRTPAEAAAAGIAVIHQHFSLVPDLTVAENLFLGREPGGIALRRAEMRRKAREVIDQFGLGLRPDDRVGTLTVGQRQMVEIAKSMLSEAWLVIMDEPTSALSTRERDRLYELIGRMKGIGCAILYISHKMEEIFTLADRAVVLRDGRFVGDRAIRDLDEPALIGMMVGRDIGNVFPHRPVPRGDLLVAVDDIADGGLLRSASLTVHAGEVVALAGLMGSGRSEVMRCIAGLSAHRAGTIRIGGADLPAGDARRANALGVAYVPEDRHLEGFVGPMSIQDNVTLAWIRARSALGLVRPSALAAEAGRLIRQLGVRPPDPRKRVGDLSGGNQQKVVIGKWLATRPRVLLLDEPTRGVDVGAKSELHALIAELKAQGAGILMVSSELPEVLGVADRIVVMHEGRTAGELPRGATETEVMALAFGRSAEVPRPTKQERVAG
ncbi:ATP-binding cassette domain-containing protein [Mycobacterium sp. KBS0706]|uniref:ATP-binding cassette domain-containing protein n=1 Tax=Mycobacterium sp. KBS0706 TaxID=2578109 RepID=UPI00110F97D2|nr:ATP-binding cassette domain-containing protein [Mycobacterium sp. KBS0706]TSD86399.1 ATP-binding cassette domain-containing protein [Mycobacterium sp. KBS0706]